MLGSALDLDIWDNFEFPLEFAKDWNEIEVRPRGLRVVKVKVESKTNLHHFRPFFRYQVIYPVKGDS